MDVYVLLSTNNVGRVPEFKKIWKGERPSPEEVCHAASEDKPIDERIEMGKFLLENLGEKMNGWWIEAY